MAETAKRTRGKGKRTIARAKALKDYDGDDPREYLAAVLADPEQYDDKRFMAANALMPYTYAKLSAVQMNADVNTTITTVEIDTSGGRGKS